MGKKIKVYDAVDRAAQLMNIPLNKLPSLAQEFRQYLYKEMGGSGEVAFTAFAGYAQVVEMLPCTDPSYQISKEHRKWFKKKK